MFRLSADFVDEDNPDILSLNNKAVKLVSVFDFSLHPSVVRFDADTTKYGNCDAVLEEGIT